MEEERDEGFEVVVERHRRELHVHCYRMLGSFDEAEDLVQDTLLRAWRSWSRFDGVALRPWLYRIATNACLDFLARKARREVPLTPAVAAVPWLQPYPDRLLAEAGAEAEAVDDVVVGRETVELGFLAALQALSPRQRAVLVLRDVVGWSAPEAASALGLTVAGVNSTLQRARATLRRHRPPSREDWAPLASPSEGERRLVERFVAACERYDVAAMVALAREDVRMVALPQGDTWEGRDAFAAETEEGFGPGAPGVLRCLVTRANGRPAVAAYLRPWDATTHRPFVLSVLHEQDGQLVELVSFHTDEFTAFGLPAEIPAAPDEIARPHPFLL